MKIKMMQSIQGSLDGVTVQALAEGVEYDTVDTAVGTRLALAHIFKGVATAVADTSPLPPVGKSSRAK